jgi:hypothetical protein
MPIYLFENWALTICWLHQNVIEMCRRAMLLEDDVACPSKRRKAKFFLQCPNTQYRLKFVYGKKK